VTDRTWLKDNSLTKQVEETIKAGATFIQLREKDMQFDEFVNEAKAMKLVTDKYKVAFVINDNIDVCLACNADGVHIGQRDIEVDKARTLLGENKILGVSAQTVEQAVLAEKNGADYLGVGAVFSTSTKLDANNVSFEILKEICEAVTIPVIAIGGISEDNIMQLKHTGIDGVAVISAIFSKSNIYEATKNIYNLSRKMVQNEN